MCGNSLKQQLPSLVSETFSPLFLVADVNMGGTFTVGLLCALETGCINDECAEEAISCAVGADIVAGALAIDAINLATNNAFAIGEFESETFKESGDMGMWV